MMTWKMTGDITATDCDILHVMELQVLNGDLTFPVGSRLMTAELLGLESKTLSSCGLHRGFYTNVHFAIERPA
jgi:hypothetical protein